MIKKTVASTKSNEFHLQYSDIIFYASPEGNSKVEVLYSDETFWLSQKRMSELFGVAVHTINYHKKEILKVLNYRRIPLFKIFE
jgi:hypothetical protein